MLSYKSFKRRAQTSRTAGVMSLCSRCVVACATNVSDQALTHRRFVVPQVVGVPEDELDRANSKILPSTQTDGKPHLPPHRLSDGVFYTRADEQSSSAPCPLCGETLDPALCAARGKIGWARYLDGAFVVTPCRKTQCVAKMKARQERLRGTSSAPKAPVKGYHQCTPQVAEAIKQAGGRMLRGAHGIAGGAIYFAQSARETEWKWEGYMKDKDGNPVPGSK